MSLATSADAKADAKADAVRSCTVSIKNSLAVTLYLDSAVTPQKGTWAGTPLPDQIAPGVTAGPFTLNPPDDSGTYGQIGYSVGNATEAPVIVLEFQCPQTHSVSVDYKATQSGQPVYTYAVPFTATVGTGAAQQNRCDSSGAPLTVSFEICYRIQQINVATVPSFPLLDEDGVAVSAAIWTPEDVNGGVTNPGLFSGPPQGHILDVAVTNDAKNSGAFQIWGRDPAGEFQFESVGPTPPTGLVTSVPVQVQWWKNAPRMARLTQNIAWDFGAASKVIATTRVELYWTLAAPQPMWSNGVWITALRDIYDLLMPVIQGQDANAQDACVQALVRACFTGDLGGGVYQKTYQLSSGFTHDGTFLLWNYRNNVGNSGQPDTTVNCVDQAPFVRTMLGAIGIATLSAQINIHPGSSTTIGGAIQPSVNVVPGALIASLADMTLWSGHSFATYAANGNALDATLGPALGTQSPEDWATSIFQAGTNYDVDTPIDVSFTVSCTRYSPQAAQALRS